MYNDNIQLTKKTSKTWKIICINKNNRPTIYYSKKQIYDMYTFENIYYPQNVDAILDEINEPIYMYDIKRPFIQLHLNCANDKYMIPLTDMIDFCTYKYETFILLWTPVQENVFCHSDLSKFIKHAEIYRLIRVSVYLRTKVISSPKKNNKEKLRMRIHSVENQLEYMKYKFMFYIEQFARSKHILTLYNDILQLNSWSTDEAICQVFMNIAALVKVFTLEKNPHNTFFLKFVHCILFYLSELYFPTYTFVNAAKDTEYSPGTFYNMEIYNVRKKILCCMFTDKDNTAVDYSYIENNQYKTNNPLIILFEYMMYSLLSKYNLIKGISEGSAILQSKEFRCLQKTLYNLFDDTAEKKLFPFPFDPDSSIGRNDYTYFHRRTKSEPSLELGDQSYYDYIGPPTKSESSLDRDSKRYYTGIEPELILDPDNFIDRSLFGEGFSPIRGEHSTYTLRTPTASV
jgi:hypothetical protein